MKRKNSSLLNSYSQFTQAERFFIMNALINISQRQRKKNSFNAARKFKSQHRDNEKFAQVSIRAYSNLLSNNQQKYSNKEIQDIYNKKYKAQFEATYNLKQPLNLNEIYKEVLKIKALLEQLASKPSNASITV